MSNLLVEIGNTALKAAWSERMTLGKTFRYQGEKFMDFILSLTRREKPEVLLLSSVYVISEADAAVLREECTYLLILDSSNKEFLVAHGLPSYLSYDRAASILAARYLFKGRGCTIVDFGTTLSVDFTGEDGMYRGGNISLGCRTRFKALNRYSRSLPLVDMPQNPEVSRRSTGIPGLSRWWICPRIRRLWVFRKRLPSPAAWFQALFLK